MTFSALTDRASIFHDVLFGQFINFLWKEPNLPLPWGRSWAQDIYAAGLLDQLPLRDAFHFHVYHCSLCVLSRDPQWNQSSWSTPLGAFLLGQQISCLSQVERNIWKTSSRTNSENAHDTFTARVITHHARNVKSRLSDPAHTSSSLQQSEHELWYFRAVAVNFSYNFTIYVTLGPRWAQRGKNAASNEGCWPVSGVKRARKRNKRGGKRCTKEKTKTEQQRQERNV